MEQTLLQCEGFEGHEAAVKEVRAPPAVPTPHTARPTLDTPLPSQGLKLWMLKVQRAGDRAFDRFEKETGETVFHVPSDLQQGAAAACVDESAVDAEVGTLESQLYQQTVLRRELQRKLAAAQAQSRAWEAERQNVRALADPQGRDALHRALTSSAQLDAALRAAQQLVGGAAPTAAAPPASRALMALGGAEQQHASRRAQIATVSVPDLAQLASLIGAC